MRLEEGSGMGGLGMDMYFGAAPQVETRAVRIVDILVVRLGLWMLVMSMLMGWRSSECA